jgi:hypothetical protein
MNQTHEHDVPPTETTRDTSEFEVLELAVRELATGVSRTGERRSAHQAAARWWPRLGPPCGVAIAEPAPLIARPPRPSFER